MTLPEFYTNAWRQKAGLKEIKVEKSQIDIKDLYKTQWHEQFEQYMRNRLVMGAMRYGDIRTTTGYQYLSYLEKKLRKYKETGNLEMLVDVANLAMLEFINSDHPKKHWNPIDNEIHCEKNQRVNA